MAVQYEEQRADAAEKLQLQIEAAIADATLPESQLPTPSFNTSALIQGRRPFHWPVEFPEVFAIGGFTAICRKPAISLGRSRIGKSERHWEESILIS